MEIKVLEQIPESLLTLKNPPEKLFYKGDLGFLNRFKVAIVGTRRPNQYTKQMTQNLASKISAHATIVSGGAIGVDNIAHLNANLNTIMVSPSSLDIIYPRQNSEIIVEISQKSLILSEYERDYMPHRFSFLERNRLIIALSDIVILPQGDLNSGTSVSARIALSLNKPIWVLPHRYGESKLTNSLLAQGVAKAIYDIDEFIEQNLPQTSVKKRVAESDEIVEFCKNGVSFEMALEKFGEKLLEYEFLGILTRDGNSIKSK